MSVKIMTLVWRVAPCRDNTLLTLLALADWSDDTGHSFPNIETLAAKSRQSVRNVQYTLGNLEEAGLLTVERKPGRGHMNSFQINLQTLHHLAGEKVQSTTLNGANGDAKRCKTEHANKEEPPRTTNEPLRGDDLFQNLTQNHPASEHDQATMSAFQEAVGWKAQQAGWTQEAAALWIIQRAKEYGEQRQVWQGLEKWLRKRTFEQDWNRKGKKQRAAPVNVVELVKRQNREREEREAADANQKLDS